MPKSTYTVKEVAGLLGFSTNTVYKYLEEGSIKAVRLGLEGRFRIPASEVDRLLQENNKKLFDIGATPTAHTENFPSIFDWFVGFISIGIGFSQFINPVYVVNSAALAGFVPFIDVICVLLVVGGILLLGFDIFNFGKNKRDSILYVAMGVLYLVLTGIFFSQSSVVAAGYLALSVVLFISVFKKMWSYLQYLIFVNVLCVLVGVAYVVWPLSFGIFDPGTYIPISKNIYILSWVTFFYFLLFSSYKAYKGNKTFVWITNSVVGIAAFLYAIISFAGGFWGSTVFGIVLGTFSFIFSVVGEFNFFETKTRKESVISFLWLFGVFIAGSLILRMMHISFQHSALTEMGKEVETASVITKSFIDKNISTLNTSLNTGKLTEILDRNGSIDELDEVLKQAFLLSGNSFARVIVTDKSGRIIDTYPFYLQSQNVDISDRDYFIQPAGTGGTYVTGLIQPKSPGISPSVLVSLPIINDNGKFLGVLIASVNILELQKQLGRINLEKRDHLAITDSQGYYIINSGVQEVIMTTSAKELIKKPSDDTDLSINYNKEGVLEFIASREVDKYGWTVWATEPQSSVMKTYNLMGFGIFLFFIMFTVGSLIFAVFLKKE
jgi:excisionase family DNA binding protein